MLHDSEPMKNSSLKFSSILLIIITCELFSVSMALQVLTQLLYVNYLSISTTETGLALLIPDKNFGKNGDATMTDAFPPTFTRKLKPPGFRYTQSFLQRNCSNSGH